MFVSSVDDHLSGGSIDFAEEFVEHLKRENRELREEVEVLKAALDLARERSEIQEPPIYEPIRQRPSMFRLRTRLEAQTRERAKNERGGN